MKVYGDTRSGNCYKTQLIMSLLDIEHEWVHINILKGDNLSDEFQAKNPNGKIPVLELDDGRFISESNAIINYLAAGSTYYPSDRFAHAEVLQWQFFEQYSHEPYIAVARFIAKYLGMPAERRDEFVSKQEGGYKALKVMEQHLNKHDYFVNNRLTTADMALFAYTHVADEGGFELNQYPAIQRWIKRIQSEPKFIPME
ncbi:glutathione S-transferase family protein [Kangiella marina]|uniref:Glutathione S-transferase family protein n=1 Tax=Kangiella marina TaxID=1079178 RepID=A0ABP8ILV8_9GAMM